MFPGVVAVFVYAARAFPSILGVPSVEKIAINDTHFCFYHFSNLTVLNHTGVTDLDFSFFHDTGSGEFTFNDRFGGVSRREWLQPFFSSWLVLQISLALRSASRAAR
nr:GP3 [Praja virus]